MKFELGYPFSEDWDWGYLQTNRENRRHVYLYKRSSADSPEKRSTVQYARYLLSVKMGRYLLEDEEADHIDNDKTNDSLDNLQVLSKTENRKKYHSTQMSCIVKMECPKCNSVFYKFRGATQLLDCLKGKVCFCSRECNLLDKKERLSKEERKRISESQILEVLHVKLRGSMPRSMVIPEKSIIFCDSVGHN